MYIIFITACFKYILTLNTVVFFYFFLLSPNRYAFFVYFCFIFEKIQVDQLLTTVVYKRLVHNIFLVFFNAHKMFYKMLMLPLSFHQKCFILNVRSIITYKYLNLPTYQNIHNLFQKKAVLSVKKTIYMSQYL